MSWSTEQEQQNTLPACRATNDPLYPLIEKPISFFGSVLTIYFQMCWNSVVLEHEQLIICYLLVNIYGMDECWYI